MNKTVDAITIDNTGEKRLLDVVKDIGMKLDELRSVINSIIDGTSIEDRIIDEVSNAVSTLLRDSKLTCTPTDTTEIIHKVTDILIDIKSSLKPADVIIDGKYTNAIIHNVTNLLIDNGLSAKPKDPEINDTYIDEILKKADTLSNMVINSGANSGDI